MTGSQDAYYVQLAQRREREITTARSNVGKARQRLERAEHALRSVETYWAQHPAELIR